MTLKIINNKSENSDKNANAVDSILPIKFLSEARIPYSNLNVDIEDSIIEIDNTDP